MGAIRGRAGILLWFFCLNAFALEAPGPIPKITYRSGIIEVKGPQDKFWRLLPESRLSLESEDSLRTGAGAALGMLFEDGSRLEFFENTVVNPRKLGGESPEIYLSQGGLQLQAKKRPSRVFLVRTIAGVLKIRGAQLSVKAMAGRVTLDVEQGSLVVRDIIDQEMLVYAGERLELDRYGMRQVQGRPSRGRIIQERFSLAMRRERALGLSHQQLRDQTAQEAKRSEFEQGKILTDVFGVRVRSESYVLRPAPNQLKWVTLNSRASGFSYLYYLATFNQALPAELRSALRQVPGGVGSAPNYFLTGLTIARSNLNDSAIEVAQGGHLVDVNHNNDAGDDVSALFDSGSNAFVGASGQNAFRSLFDRYGLYVNGMLKYGWTGANIQSYANDAVLATTIDPITGAALAQALPVRTVSGTFPDLAQAHKLVYQSFGDGSFLQSDQYSMDQRGHAASLSEFGGPTTGVSYQSVRIRFNYQEVVTAAAFQGRSINLVVEPKIVTLFGVLP